MSSLYKEDTQQKPDSHKYQVSDEGISCVPQGIPASPGVDLSLVLTGFEDLEDLVGILLIGGSGYSFHGGYSFFLFRL